MKTDTMAGRLGHVTRGTARPDAWQEARIWWRRILEWGRRRPRRLRLCESLPLGDRRFVAVVEFDESRFLVGGTAASLVLLARLSPAGPSDEPKRMPEEES